MRTTRLHPRLRLDLPPDVILAALARCAQAGDAPREARTLEESWAPAGDGLATLSVRSAFDLFLTALALPAGSEVLFSAVTLPDMARIVREHGLVPVPVDIERHTLAPTLEALERAHSERSRVLVLAHLLGGRFDPSPMIAWARSQGLRVVEDCAQGFVSPDERGHAEADLSCYSFGTIKTCTAVGGALSAVRDPALLAAMRRVQAGWPVQPAPQYAQRLLRAGLLLGVQEPHVYRGIERLTALAGVDFHQFILRAIRGFPVPPGGTLRARVQLQPCAALLTTLHERLATFTPVALAARAARGERTLRRLAKRVPMLGAQQPRRTHWLVGAEVSDRAAVIARGLRSGFDLAGATNIAAIPRPPERPDLPPTEAERFMARVVFVPAHAGVPAEALEDLVEVVAHRGREDPLPASLPRAHAYLAHPDHDGLGLLNRNPLP